MGIHKLSIQHFRNIRSANIDFHPRFNILIGHNGAGKTAILEAIYFLSLGRSFRSKQINRIIQTGQQQLLLFARTDDKKLGLSRSMTGEANLKLDGEALGSHVQVTRHLPVLLFNPESFQLFTEGAKPRRQLIDWGVFYQTPGFLHDWQQYKQALRQRNAALKANQRVQQIKLWDPILIDTAQRIDQYREDYVVQLQEALQHIVGDFIDQHDIQLSYYRGWPKEKPLAQALEEGLVHDRQLGFSHYGPHRADLRLRVRGKPAQEILSRGQQKVLVCGLKLAQGRLLQTHTQRRCIYLLDDIASELDRDNRLLLLDYLQKLDAQVLLTSINDDIAAHFQDTEAGRFRLNAGAVEKIASITSL